MNPSEKVKYISNWIKSYVDQMPSKAESLVIGISGGIDSSVSSTLSAMTGLKTIVLSMPIKQKENQHDLSLKHKDWLVKNFKNVEAHNISLDKLFEEFSSTLNKFDNEHGFANSRARLRMTTLYQVAAENKGMGPGGPLPCRLRGMVVPAGLADPRSSCRGGDAAGRPGGAWRGRRRRRLGRRVPGPGLAGLPGIRRESRGGHRRVRRQLE